MRNRCFLSLLSEEGTEGAAALTSVATTQDSGAVSQAAMAAMQGPTAASISACSALPTAALWPLVEMIISG